jgi:hypothetical protein
MLNITAVITSNLTMSLYYQKILHLAEGAWHFWKYCLSSFVEKLIKTVTIMKVELFCMMQC